MLSNKLGVRLIFSSIICLLFVSCAIQNLKTLPEQDIAAPEKYVIGPEDVLQIHVWKQPELSVTVPVRSDGKISAPLIEEITAAGLTPEQLNEEITERLKKFIEEPVVSIIVTEINSLKISVSGNVASPGIYKIGEKISLVEAISLAGGINRMGDAKKVRIIRGEGDSREIYQINYKSIISKGEIEQDIFVYPGDSIIVP